MPSKVPATSPSDTEAHRIIRSPKVQELTGLARSTIYALVKAGRFPNPRRLGPRAVGWRLSDVLAWLEAPERGYDPNGAA